MTGVVSSFGAVHGYGWISCSDGGADAWVHRSDLQNARWLEVGDEVQFQLTEEVGGRRRALHVEKFSTERDGKDEDRVG